MGSCMDNHIESLQPLVVLHSSVVYCAGGMAGACQASDCMVEQIPWDKGSLYTLHVPLLLLKTVPML